MKKITTPIRLNVRNLFAGCAVAAMLIFSPCTVWAQSVLSLTYPVGVPQTPNSGMSMAMGGSCAGVSSNNNIMLRNPATLGAIDRAAFSSLFTFDMTQISENGNSQYTFSGYPRQISFGIPITLIGTIGFAYDQRSDANTKFRLPTSPVQYDLDTQVTFRSGLAVNGGLIAWQAGWGREFGKKARVRVGAVYERLYFAYSKNIVSTVTTSTSTLGLDARDSAAIRFGGNAVRAGVLVPVGEFTIGLSGEYYLPAEAKSNHGSYAAGSSEPTEFTTHTATIQLPPSLCGGLSYNISSEWLAAADLSAVFWSSYQSGGMLVDSRENTAVSVSAGAQFIPAPNILSPRYWEIINYRAGLRFTQLPAAGSDETAVTAGVGLPVGRGSGLVDVALDIGTRASDLYPTKENFVHVSIGINGGRKWNKSTTGLY
jgi:hypothetical protein